MEYNRFDFRYPGQRGRFGSVTGRITEMVPYGMRNSRMESTCMILVTVEGEDGNITNFTVTPATYIVDFLTLEEGMLCTFWYRLDAPAILIYPPQYTAVAVARQEENRSVDVDYYNEMLLNESRSLRLNIDNSVKIRTTNNQIFQGSPANRELVVIYDMSTRSIPAQTTPLEIVVLCEMG